MCVFKGGRMCVSVGWVFISWETALWPAAVDSPAARSAYTSSELTPRSTGPPTLCVRVRAETLDAHAAVNTSHSAHTSSIPQAVKIQRLFLQLSACPAEIEQFWSVDLHCRLMGILYMTALDLWPPVTSDKSLTGACLRAGGDSDAFYSTWFFIDPHWKRPFVSPSILRVTSEVRGRTATLETI